MTKIPVGTFEPPKPGSLTSDQRLQLADKYPIVGSDAALDAVEYILNELFVDIERYRTLPSYAAALKVIKDLRQTLDKSRNQLRSLTTSGADNMRLLLAVELENELATMKAGKHLSLAIIDDELGTVEIALEGIIAKLTARYGGKKGKPPEVAVDMWIERMICLWHSLGGEIATTWVDDSVSVEGFETGSSGRRIDKFFDLLGDLVSTAKGGFGPGSERMTAVAANLSVRALDQRAYRVLAAWKKAPAHRRHRREDEIRKFCTSVLRPSPSESGIVPSREKEARDDGDTDKRHRKRQSARSSGSTRTKPAKR